MPKQLLKPPPGRAGRPSGRTLPGASPAPGEARTDQVHAQEISVSYRYPVHFTAGALDPHNPALLQSVCRREPARGHRLFVVVDSGVAEAWPDLPGRIKSYCDAHARALELLASPEVVPGGEHAKQSSEPVLRIQARLHALGIDRQSFVVVIGGGAVLDMVGYAAATTHRGVRLVRMPTTVLSQGDSGIGVKNGINAFGSKNFLGTFQPPFAVINDREFLATLPRRECISGTAEAVKVALIRDPAFFAWLAAHSRQLASCDPVLLDRMIRRSAELHLEHIATCGDPFELGSARPLDFGHWAAHRLESLTGYRLRHGEAVAIGMAIDACYSVEVGLLGKADLRRICTLLEGLGLRLWDEALGNVYEAGKLAVLRGLDEFREHQGGPLAIMLLQGIGRGIEVHDISERQVIRALEWLEARDAARCS